MPDVRNMDKWLKYEQKKELKEIVDSVDRKLLH